MLSGSRTHWTQETSPADGRTDTSLLLSAQRRCAGVLMGCPDGGQVHSAPAGGARGSIPPHCPRRKVRATPLACRHKRHVPLLDKTCFASPPFPAARAAYWPFPERKGPCTVQRETRFAATMHVRAKLPHRGRKPGGRLHLVTREHTWPPGRAAPKDPPGPQRCPGSGLCPRGQTG